MNAKELALCTGARIDRAEVYLPYLLAAMQEFEINTPERKAMFLAQVGHETGGLRWLTELWGPTPAQLRYEGRKDLGNTQTGDAFRFRGRGCIQTTGRGNYSRVSNALGVDFVANPDWLSLPEYAARSGGLFWKQNNLNVFADARDVIRATKRINGGLNGLADRANLYAAAVQVFA